MCIFSFPMEINFISFPLSFSPLFISHPQSFLCPFTLSRSWWCREKCFLERRRWGITKWDKCFLLGKMGCGDNLHRPIIFYYVSLLPCQNYTPLNTHTEMAMTPHSGTLAWQIPCTEEPGGLQSMGCLRVGHYWATSLSLFTFLHWRRKWQPTPMFLPGESQG